MRLTSFGQTDTAALEKATQDVKAATQQVRDISNKVEMAQLPKAELDKAMADLNNKVAIVKKLSQGFAGLGDRYDSEADINTQDDVERATRNDLLVEKEDYPYSQQNVDRALFSGFKEEFAGFKEEFAGFNGIGSTLGCLVLLAALSAGGYFAWKHFAGKKLARRRRRR